MDIKPIKILLIEDSPGDYEIILHMLDKSEKAEFELSHSTRLDNGLRMFK